MSAGLFNTIVAVVTLVGLAWLLSRPKVRESRIYKATRRRPSGLLALRASQ
jgi:hypothetical protein